MRQRKPPKRNSAAELARTVSHDVNNALGSMLPLVHTQEDLQGGTLEPFVFKEDLEQVQKSLQVCRRVSVGCCPFPEARCAGAGTERFAAPSNTASAILKYGWVAEGIDSVAEHSDDLPVVCGQSDSSKKRRQPADQRDR